MNDKVFCPITKGGCREDCAWMVLDNKNTYTCAVQVMCDMANEITERCAENED